MVAPEIAIADSNTLSCMGLQSLLEEIIPMAVIRVFSSFEELMDDTPDMYAHYFVSAQIYFEHTAFFLPRKPKTIVLANGDNQPQLAGIPTLNIYQDEKTLIKNILQLHQFGHKGGHSHSHPHGHPHGATAHPCGNPHADSEHDLSPREIEVLVLITKGLINKEIADKLNISLTTVISHRKEEILVNNLFTQYANLISDKNLSSTEEIFSIPVCCLQEFSIRGRYSVSAVFSEVPVPFPE